MRMKPLSPRRLASTLLLHAPASATIYKTMTTTTTTTRKRKRKRKPLPPRRLVPPAARLLPANAVLHLVSLLFSVTPCSSHAQSWCVD
jgi:hypothetical protein